MLFINLFVFMKWLQNGKINTRNSNLTVHLKKKLTSVLTEGWVFDGLYHLRDIFKFVRKKTDISINIFILDELYVQSKDENYQT